MTVFFGRVLAAGSVAALVLQAITTRMLRRFGVARGLLALPLVLAVGSALFIVQPALGASLLGIAVIVRTAEMGVRYAIDKPALELLYMPLQGPLRASAKGWLDTVADRFGGAVTALIWLALQLAFDIEEPSRVWIASVAIVSITALWAAFAWRARRYHLDAFAVALARSDATSRLDSERALDQVGANVVRRAVTEGNPSELQVALELLADPANARADVEVSRLVHHSNPSVRARAIDVLRARGEAPRPDIIATLLGDPSIAVRVAALEWLLATGPSRIVIDPTQNVPVPVRDLLTWAGEPIARRRETVGALAESPDPERRAIAAVMAANLGETSQLHRLCDDEDPAVVAAALGAMRPPQSHDEIALMLRLGARTGARAHAVERLALAPLGRLSHSWSRASSNGARSLLCDAIARSREPGAPDVLAALASRADGVLRRRAWRGLALRRVDGGDAPARATCERLVDEQMERLGARAGARLRFESDAHDEVLALMRRALDESLDLESAALFDSLALIAPAREVREIHLWLRDATARTRATCIEFLDNALPVTVRTRVVRALEPSDPVRRRAALIEQSHQALPRDRDDALRQLASADDGWLRALAIDALARQGLRASRMPLRDEEHDARVEEVFADLRARVPWPI
jgi:hypothetical protein